MDKVFDLFSNSLMISLLLASSEEMHELALANANDHEAIQLGAVA
jgi:hypothetical protein